jgi:hypothetical protein
MKNLLESSSADVPAASTALVAATVKDDVHPVDIGVAPRFHDAASAVRILWTQLEVASSDASRDPPPPTAAADAKGIKSERQRNRHIREAPTSSKERGEGRTADEDAVAAAKSRVLHEKGISFPLDLSSLHSGWSDRTKAGGAAVRATAVMGDGGHGRHHIRGRRRGEGL